MIKKHLGWVLAALVVIGCGGRYHRGDTGSATTGTNTTGTNTTGTTGAAGVLVYAVGDANRLVTFRTDAPATLLSDTTIGGPDASDPIVALDRRNGTLYGMTRGGQLYSLNNFGGGLVLGFPMGSGFGSGTSPVVDMDFDPADGTLRVVLEDDSNLRVNPSGEIYAHDTPFVYTGAGTAVVSGIAYAPSGSAFPLYAYAGYNQLTRSTNPTGGNLDFYNTDANLPVSGDPYGLDIDATGTAILSVDGTSASTLITVNTATGVGQSIGATKAGLHIRSLCFDDPTQSQ